MWTYLWLWGPLLMPEWIGFEFDKLGVNQCPEVSVPFARWIDRLRQAKQREAAITEGVQVIKYLLCGIGPTVRPRVSAASQREGRSGVRLRGRIFLLLRMDKRTGWRLFFHGSEGGKEELLEGEVTDSWILISDAKETKNSQAALGPNRKLRNNHSLLRKWN